MDILTNFSENLNELAFDKNLTFEEFAKAVEIDRSVIYKYLRKECLPTLPNLIKIADYFDCSADYLLGLSQTNTNTGFKSAPPFSQRFKELLKSKNLTRYKFLQEIHFARQSVDDWYNGKRYPNIDNTLELAKYFGCSIDYLLGREN